MIILIIGAKWIYPLWKVIQRKGSWLVRPAQGEILRGCRGGRRLEVNEGADSWPQPAGVGLLLGRRRTRELAPNQAPSSPEGAESVHSHISPLLCLKPPGILFVSTFLQEGLTSSEQCVLMDKRSTLGASPVPIKGECDPKYFWSPSLLMELFCHSFYDDHQTLSE